MLYITQYYVKCHSIIYTKVHIINYFYYIYYFTVKIGLRVIFNVLSVISIHNKTNLEKLAVTEKDEKNEPTMLQIPVNINIGTYIN